MKRLTEKGIRYDSSRCVDELESLECDIYNKLADLEDLLENADSIKIIKRNGVASLHIDMILDNETYPIAEELFGKEKVEDYDK